MFIITFKEYDSTVSVIEGPFETYETVSSYLENRGYVLPFPVWGEPYVHRLNDLQKAIVNKLNPPQHYSK